MKAFLLTALILVSSIPGWAQRDFLTADEVDKIREVQEPNARLQLYLLFARQRIDQLKQAVAKEKKGRTLQIRELLEDYAKIIDAIDTVSDDALKRKVDISIAAEAVRQTEKSFLEVLTKIEDSHPHDFELYDVAFKDALENTKDSIDQASSDLAMRQQQVIEKSEQEKEAVKSVLTAKEVKERASEEKKVEEAPGGRKPPTLYRKGEKPSETDPTKPQSKPPQQF